MASLDLRPMSLGEVLDRTFTLYREQFLLFAGIAALPYLLEMLLRLGMLLFQQSQATTSGSLQSPALIGGAVAAGIGWFFVWLLMMGITQSATVSAVSDLYLGRETTVRDSYAKVKAKVLIVVGIIVLSFLAAGAAALLFIIPGIYLWCRLAVSVPAAVVEGESPVAAMQRSMDLTRGSAMQLFLLLLLVGLIGYAVGMLLQIPVFAWAFTAGLSGGHSVHSVPFALNAYSLLAGFLSQVLVGPVGTISASLMYYNLRVRKEGFDIQHLLTTLTTAPAQGTPGI